MSRKLIATRGIKRILIVSKNDKGEIVMKSATQKMADDTKEFKFSLDVGDKVIETMKLSSDAAYYAEMGRSGYFGMLDNFIEHCHEAFSSSLAGDSKYKKADILHEILKAKYCELHPEYYKIINSGTPWQPKESADSIGVEAIKSVFSVENNTHLTSEQLLAYYDWAESFLEVLHIDKYGYGVQK